MNLALAVWQGRISPVFDVSRSLCVVRLNAAGAVESREEIALGAVAPPQRAALLAGLRIEVLICGAVSAPLAEMLMAAGIRTIPFVAGEAEAVLAAFRRGELPSPRYMQPGCRCGKRRCRRGRNCGRA